ncbi:MAG: hypothetical protein ABIO30_00635 [Thermomonas sp.]
MFNKNTLMLAVLLPGLAVLAGCDRHDADDTVTPAATAEQADNMPAETMPADNMPADNMPADNMPADNMAGHDMAAMGDEMSFADMDKNHDGGITHDEMADSEMLHQHFKVADTNADGMLSEAEVMHHRADMAAAPAK